MPRPLVAPLTLLAGLALPATVLRAQAGDSTVLARFCGDATRSASEGALVGRVRSAEDGAPLAGVAVVLRWEEIGVDRASGRATLTPQSRATVTDDQARYRFCTVPRYTVLLVQAQAADRRSGAVQLRLQEEPVLVRALSLSLATTADSGARGTASLLGEVVTASGHPVRGARAVVDASATGEAVANDTGVFVLSQLPAGTQTLVVRAIGYVPKRLSLELKAGATSGVTVVLDQTVRMLDSVRVIARRGMSDAAWRVAYDQRRRASAGGTFVDDVEIRRRDPVNTVDIFRRIRGLSVSSDGVVTLTRGAASLSDAVCIPLLVLDGLPLDTTVDIVRPDEIRGIEVYRGPAETPPEYGGACGVIVIWTKR